LCNFGCLKIDFQIEKVSYIIVGQGLAGSTLALRLLEKGKRFIVFDRPDSNRSSVIAAGLFNPITGKYLTKTWIADEIFSELQLYYSWAEKYLNKRFYFPKSMYRPFVSIEEQNEWMGKSSEPGFRDYITEAYTKSAFGAQVNDQFGGIALSNCGFIDTNVFIESVRSLLISTNSFLEEKIDDINLEIKDDGVVYNNFQAEKIIFCTGYESKFSRFSSIPIRVLKGETLTVELPEKLEHIYNRGVFMVPFGNDLIYKVGATYEPNLLSEGITETGRFELERKLKDLLKLDYKIIDQEWGFRPTTADRKPILGHVPESKNVIIFNGLGTKGVSLAPYFSKQLVNWLTNDGEIQKEVNINRFKSLFSKSSVVV
jgi:glycine/D-amino acid oxidase-like deaminating enzyme